MSGFTRGARTLAPVLTFHTPEQVHMKRLPGFIRSPPERKEFGSAVRPGSGATRPLQVKVFRRPVEVLLVHLSIQI